MEIGVEFGKFMIMLVRKCYRSICNHPFLVGFLCCLFLLYRSFPFLFSLLVSASPILVCTAVLLGTLLSFGEPHLPEVEKEERVSREMSHLKTGFMGNSTVVVSRDERSTDERFMGHKRDIIERSVEQLVSSNNEARIPDEEDGLLESTPLINDHRSPETRGRDEQQEGAKIDRKEEDDEQGGGKGHDLDSGEVGEHRYSLIEEAEDDVQDENGKMKRELIDAHVECPVGLILEGVDKEEEEKEEEEHEHEEVEEEHEHEEEEEHEHEEEEENDESLDSESEHAESSSPDASMADILPLLDELHPLLEREESHATKMSHNESDASSEHSHKSENGNVESEDDSENLDAEDGENENDEDDEEGEEESQAGSKGDASKSAITWTEDDQKNLMDLGTSELERNQRLENLIARRRARRMMAEKNLIDFDGADLPFNVPSIATTRRNPFDGPDDSYSNMGLPPIPGSAPSVLLPRRNPFDLPYEPNEEKPDLKEDSFQQEFIPDLPTKPPPYHNQQRDNLFFRRHESFSVGPSSLGLSRQEKQDIKWKPYFVPEHFTSEGTSFRSFERQSSGMSESKASSVPDTESVTSTMDHEEKRVDEPEEFLHETEEMSNVDRVSLLVEHGSMASEDLDNQETDEEEEKRNAHRDEVEIILGNGQAEAESEHDIGLSPSWEGTGTATSTPPLDESNIGFEVKAEQESGKAAEDEENDDDNKEEEKEGDCSRSGSSSSSVFSEVDAQINEVKKEVQEASSSQINYPDKELRPGVEAMEFTFMTDHHKEPVYDSSPPAVEKSLSFSPDPLDLPANRELEVVNENVQSDDHNSEDDARVSEVTEIRGDNLLQDGLSKFEEVLADQSGTLVVCESVNEQVSNVSSSPSSGIESVGNDLVNDLYLHHEHASIEPVPSNLSSVMTEIATDIVDSFQSEQARIDSPISVDNIVASNHDLVQLEECHGTEMETDVQFHNTVQRTDMMASSHWPIVSNFSGESLQGEHQFVPEDRPTSPEEVSEMGDETNEEQVKESDIKMDTSQEPSFVLEESLVATYNENPSEIPDDGGKDLLVISNFTSKSPSFSPASSNYESPTVGPDSRDHTACGTDFGILQRQISEYYDPSAEVFTSLSMDEASNEGGDDEIKDIDEGFLTELDTVGDFRVKETSEGSHSPIKDGDSASELLNHSRSGPDLPVLEARSLEDITMAFRQLHEGADVEEVILPSSIDNNFKIHEGPESGLPVIEARTLDDIHVVKQIVEDNLEEMPKETVGKSHDAEDSVSGGSCDVKGSNNLNPESTNLPDTCVVKRTVEDDFVEMPEEAAGKSCKVDDFVPKGTADINETKGTDYLTQAGSNLPVLEVRSVEDVTVAFMQLDEGAEIEEVILPSSIKDQQDLKSLEGTSLGLPVVEAKSLDDIHYIKKQVMEGDPEEVPKQIVESQDRSVNAEVTQEVKDVTSTGTISSEPEGQETPVVSVVGQRDDEVSTLKSLDSPKKKVRSRKSILGSSSSSSSSSSDSD